MRTISEKKNRERENKEREREKDFGKKITIVVSSIPKCWKVREGRFTLTTFIVSHLRHHPFGITLELLFSPDEIKFQHLG